MSASNLEWLEFAMALRRGPRPFGIERTFHAAFAPTGFELDRRKRVSASP